MRLDPRKRILFLGGAIVLSLAVLVLLLLIPGAEYHPVDARIRELVRAVERRERETLVDAVDGGLLLSWRNETERLTRDGVGDRVDRIFARFPYISIRPVRMDVTPDPIEDGIVQVNYLYHWTVTTEMYPNMRSRSEERTEDGQPEQATIILRRRNGQWQVAEIQHRGTYRP